MSPFKFSLSQQVKMTESDESGKVIGRAEYTDRGPQYYIRYKAGNGGQVETWWGEEALVAA